MSWVVRKKDLKGESKQYICKAGSSDFGPIGFGAPQPFGFQSM